MIDADSAFRAGMAAIGSDQEAEALAAVKAAQGVHPNDPRLWHVAGLLHRALDDLGAAVECCERAARLAPRDFGIVHLRARVALEAGLPAVGLYEQALRLDRPDSAVLGFVEAIHAEQGRDQAIARLDALLAADPGWIEAHAYAARLRAVAGQETSISFERALVGAPGDIYLWRELIITHIHAERFEDALAAIARGRAAAGPHLIFDANEAVCVDELGDHHKAAELFAPLAAIDEVDLVVRRARNLLRLGLAGEAADLLEPRLAGSEAPEVAPYLVAAWRAIDDPRWEWLEGGEKVVGVYDLADAFVDFDRLAANVRSLHREGRQPLDQSLRGGTQTEGSLLSRISPEIQELRRILADAVRAHIDQLPPVDPAHPILGQRRGGPVRFAGSWSVRLTDGGHHADHFHPAGWFSSAFYLAVPEGKDEAGWLKLGEPHPDLRLALPPTRRVEPRPGRLVLFPSTMWHGTTPFAQGERLTVAFDVARPR
jgi:tetratricopeptide (TPR) repeat protein